MEFNPNMMSLSDLASLSPMGNTAMGIYGSALPQGMINREGQAFMGQQQPAEKGMAGADMMKLASMAMQGFGRGQQAPQAPTQQIIRDTNQFRFAGNPQQAMAQMLRQRG